MADKAKMGFAFLAVVVVAIISVGCGGSGAPDDAAEEFIPRLDEYDSDASSSLVGIVYPESAREVSADDETAVFELPDWTYEEAVAWYEEQMPAGTPYRDLSYCGATVSAAV